MKANELMIGDWVQDRSGAKMKIMNIEYHCTRVLYNGEELILACFEQANLRPIPITPEILEKNGFKEYDGLYRLDIADGVFVNADFKSKEPFVSVHNTCYRAIPICWYLHQLQHALRLCGIDKEIEL